jgi:hypothetical protein
MTCDASKLLDKVLDILGTAAVAVPMLVTGLPGWAIGICGVVALVTGRAASGRGVPLLSSFAPAKKPDDQKPA